MKQKKIFYGWINLGILWFSYAAVVSSITYAFGVVVSDMADSLGMSMALATGAYTGYTLVQAITAPLAGLFINRFGAKKSILFGLMCMLTGCILMAFVIKSVFMYYIFWIVFIGFGMRFGTLIPSQVSISKWFFHYRGLAMAILLTAGGIGGYLFTPLCTYVNAVYSWRHVWLIISACIAITILLVILLLKESPDGIRQEVDGGKKAQKGGAEKKKASYVYKTTDPWELKDARKCVSLYMLIFLFFASSYQLSAISSQGINHLLLQGIGRNAAASAVGLFALINTFSRLAVGVLEERASTKQILGAGSLLSILGFVLMLFVRSDVTAYLALILSGLGYGIMMVAPQNILLNYFGSHDYAKINGLFSLVAGVLAAFPTVIIGWMYDLNGTYTFAWMLGIVMMIISLVIAICIKPPVYCPKVRTTVSVAIKQP
jgi:OFA family oxalate/formate antiporter-like MFS transporter